MAVIESKTMTINKIKYNVDFFCDDEDRYWAELTFLNVSPAAAKQNDSDDSMEFVWKIPETVKNKKNSEIEFGVKHVYIDPEADVSMITSIVDLGEDVKNTDKAFFVKDNILFNRTYVRSVISTQYEMTVNFIGESFDSSTVDVGLYVDEYKNVFYGEEDIWPERWIICGFVPFEIKHIKNTKANSISIEKLCMGDVLVDSIHEGAVWNLSNLSIYGEEICNWDRLSDRQVTKHTFLKESSVNAYLMMADWTYYVEDKTYIDEIVYCHVLGVINEVPLKENVEDVVNLLSRGIVSDEILDQIRKNWKDIQYVYACSLIDKDMDKELYDKLYSYIHIKEFEYEGNIFYMIEHSLDEATINAKAFANSIANAETDDYDEENDDCENTNNSDDYEDYDDSDDYDESDDYDDYDEYDDYDNSEYDDDYDWYNDSDYLDYETDNYEEDEGPSFYSENCAFFSYKKLNAIKINEKSWYTIIDIKVNNPDVRIPEECEGINVRALYILHRIDGIRSMYITKNICKLNITEIFTETFKEISVDKENLFYKTDAEKLSLYNSDNELVYIGAQKYFDEAKLLRETTALLSYSFKGSLCQKVSLFDSSETENTTHKASNPMTFCENSFSDSMIERMEYILIGEYVYVNEYRFVDIEDNVIDLCFMRDGGKRFDYYYIDYKPEFLEIIDSDFSGDPEIERYEYEEYINKCRELSAEITLIIRTDKLAYNSQLFRRHYWTIDVDDSETKGHIIKTGGLLLTKNMNKVIYAFPFDEREDLFIPDGVKSIDIMNDTAEFFELSVPDSIKHIDTAFLENNLTPVRIYHADKIYNSLFLWNDMEKYISADKIIEIFNNGERELNWNISDSIKEKFYIFYIGKINKFWSNVYIDMPEFKADNYHMAHKKVMTYVNATKEILDRIALTMKHESNISYAEKMNHDIRKIMHKMTIFLEIYITAEIEMVLYLHKVKKLDYVMEIVQHEIVTKEFAATVLEKLQGDEMSKEELRKYTVTLLDIINKKSESSGKINSGSEDDFDDI